MLRNTEERSILEKAQEPGLRNPQRPEYGIENILVDFLSPVQLKGQKILELGPGHYEFCEKVRRKGAIPEALEIDPPVAELGRRRGFQVHEGNIRHLPSIKLPGDYDGLFCKGSNNPFWFYDDKKALRDFTNTLVRLLNPSGWAWIVASPATDKSISGNEYGKWLKYEREVYADLGFNSWNIPNRWRAAFYGISFEPPEMTVYYRNPAQFKPTRSHLLRQCKFIAQATARRMQAFISQ